MPITRLVESRCAWRLQASNAHVKPDDELCLCFHVTKRKVTNWIRVTKPRRVGQLSECYGAGTGCGWCRPFLERLFQQAAAAGETIADRPPDVSEVAAEPTAEEYAHERAKYVRAGKGTPPAGATPIEP